MTTPMCKSKTSEYWWESLSEDELLDEVIDSCREKKLRLTNSERETRLDLVGMLSAQALNYITTGRHKIPM